MAIWQEEVQYAVESGYERILVEVDREAGGMENDVVEQHLRDIGYLDLADMWANWVEG